MPLGLAKLPLEAVLVADHGLWPAAHPIEFDIMIKIGQTAARASVLQEPRNPSAVASRDIMNRVGCLGRRLMARVETVGMPSVHTVHTARAYSD